MRIAIGRLQGSVKQNQQISLVKKNGAIKKCRIKELYLFEGLGKSKVESKSRRFMRYCWVRRF